VGYHYRRHLIEIVIEEEFPPVEQILFFLLCFRLYHTSWQNSPAS
jgi:hypothetical protein